jgi:hypothetical protein
MGWPHSDGASTRTVYCPLGGGSGQITSSLRSPSMTQFAFES